VLACQQRAQLGYSARASPPSRPDPQCVQGAANGDRSRHPREYANPNQVPNPNANNEPEPRLEPEPASDPPPPPPQAHRRWRRQEGHERDTTTERRLRGHRAPAAGHDPSVSPSPSPAARTRTRARNPQHGSADLARGEYRGRRTETAHATRANTRSRTRYRTRAARTARRPGSPPYPRPCPRPRAPVPATMPALEPPYPRPCTIPAPTPATFSAPRPHRAVIQCRLRRPGSPTLPTSLPPPRQPPVPRECCPPSSAHSSAPRPTHTSRRPLAPVCCPVPPAARSAWPIRQPPAKRVPALSSTLSSALTSGPPAPHPLADRVRRAYRGRRTETAHATRAKTRPRDRYRTRTQTRTRAWTHTRGDGLPNHGYLLETNPTLHCKYPHASRQPGRDRSGVDGASTSLADSAPVPTTTRVPTEPRKPQVHRHRYHQPTTGTRGHELEGSHEQSKPHPRDLTNSHPTRPPNQPPRVPYHRTNATTLLPPLVNHHSPTTSYRAILQQYQTRPATKRDHLPPPVS
jgi:hypothetical protein